MGIMTSYNRIGCTYAAVHSNLMLNVMRGEWKYQGLIIDDAQQGNNNDEYANGPMMCEAGTNVFCLDGGRGGQLTQYVTQNKDGGLLKKMQESNKYIMYALLKSYMGDGDPEEIDEETMKAMMYKQEHPWWLNVVNGICIGTYTITGLLAAAYVVFEILEKKKGAIA
jgi:beta-glucosidase